MMTLSSLASLRVEITTFTDDKVGIMKMIGFHNLHCRKIPYSTECLCATRKHWVYKKGKGTSRKTATSRQSIFVFVLFVWNNFQKLINSKPWYSRETQTPKLITLVLVMTWYRQATSYYLSQCWPKSMSPYGFSMAIVSNLHLMGYLMAIISKLFNGHHYENIGNIIGWFDGQWTWRL